MTSPNFNFGHLYRSLRSGNLSSKETISFSQLSSLSLGLSTIIYLLYLCHCFSTIFYYSLSTLFSLSLSLSLSLRSLSFNFLLLLSLFLESFKTCRDAVDIIHLLNLHFLTNDFKFECLKNVLPFFLMQKNLRSY